MTLDQGVELLRNKLSHPFDDATSASASKLLAALSYMPLAITQAVAYINKHWPRTTVASYARDLHTSDKRREKLLREATADLRRDEEASNSILATWQITFERIREEKPSATDLLSFMSFFNPQGIPELIIRHYVDSEQDAVILPQGPDEKFISGLHGLGNENDDDDFEDDLGILRSYSLVTTNVQGDSFEMHRLVKFATRTWPGSFGGEDI